jgi:hypothetical protein
MRSLIHLPTAHSSLHSSLRDTPQFIRRRHSLYERKIEALSRGMNTTEIKRSKNKEKKRIVPYSMADI